MNTATHKSARKTLSRNAACERCWILVGHRRGPIWLARRIAHAAGGPARVEFDGLRALRREERHRDVIGFLHTHPHGDTRPSGRDLRTMHAWCSAFGKPLLCVIAAAGRIAAFRFDDNQSEPAELANVEQFPLGILVGVEHHARQTAS